jgi:hypothetical protein
MPKERAIFRIEGSVPLPQRKRADSCSLADFDLERQAAASIKEAWRSGNPLASALEPFEGRRFGRRQSTPPTVACGARRWHAA